MTCKGICIRHKDSYRYDTGNKRCQICAIFIKWDGVSCPCCGYKLRTGPRSFKFKAKLRLKKQKEKLMQKTLKNTSNIVSHAQ